MKTVVGNYSSVTKHNASGEVVETLNNVIGRDTTGRLSCLHVQIEVRTGLVIDLTVPLGAAWPEDKLNGVEVLTAAWPEVLAEVIKAAEKLKADERAKVQAHLAGL